MIITRNDRDVDLKKHLPEFLTKDGEINAVLAVESKEHKLSIEAIEDLFDQLFVDTATWGLRRWEKLLNVVPEALGDYVRRRNKIVLLLSSKQTSTKKFMKMLVERYVSTDSIIEIIEDNPNYQFWVVDKGGRILYPKDLFEAVDTYKPAHLQFCFRQEQDTYWGTNGELDEYGNLVITEDAIRIALANSFSSWRNVPLQSPNDNDLNVILNVLTNQSGIINVGAGYTIKDGTLIPNAAIVPMRSIIREVPIAYQPLPSSVVDILVPSYSVVKAMAKTSNHRTRTISIASANDGKANLRQVHMPIGSKMKTLGIETPKSTALIALQAFLESVTSYREIEAKSEKLPAEITDILKPAYNRLYASSSNGKHVLRYLYLTTPKDALQGVYAATRAFQISRREIPLSTKNVPKWIFDFNFNQAAILANTKLKRQTSKVLKLDAPNDGQAKARMAAAITDGKGQRTIKFGVPGDGKNELFAVAQQLRSSSKTVAVDSDQIRNILHGLEGDGFGDVSSELKLVTKNQRLRHVIIGSNHDIDDVAVKSKAALWNSRNNLTTIGENAEQLQKLFKTEELSKATIMPTVSLTETSTRQLTIKQQCCTDGNLRATTVIWNGRSRRVEIGAAEQDGLPKEVTDLLTPANTTLHANSRTKRQDTKTLSIETPKGKLVASTVFLFTDKTRRRVVNAAGNKGANSNAKVTLWNQRSRYVEIGLNLEQLERLMPRKETNVLPHVGLVHVGAMAVQ